jgi:two-component system chemotaxis sensor kinase CheA
MPGNGDFSAGPHSEGFEAIMARFFNPDGAESPGASGLAPLLEELQSRPGDPELHGDLARRFAQLGAQEDLDGAAQGLVAALEALFGQMANFDIRLHRAMYQDLEQAVPALEALRQGQAPERPVAELEGRIRRHLLETEADEAATAAAPAEADAESVVADLEALSADPADEAALDRLGRTLDDLSESLSDEAETLALRMGDVLGNFAEGHLAWGDDVQAALRAGARALAGGDDDPAELVAQLQDLLTAEVATDQGGAPAAPPAEADPAQVLADCDRLLADSGDEAVLNDLGAQLDDLSEALTGERETLALRMGDVLGAYAAGRLEWSEDLGKRLRAGAEVLANGGDPAPVIAGLEAVMGQAQDEATDAEAEAGPAAAEAGEGDLGAALEALIASPSDRALLEQARSAAVATAERLQAEGGPLAALGQRLQAIFEGLAAFDIRLHKVMVQDLQAAMGAVEGEDEQAAEDAHARLAKHVPEAPGDSDADSEEGEVAAEAGEAPEAPSEPAPEAVAEPAPAPEPEPEPEPTQDEASVAQAAQPTEDEGLPEGVAALPEDADPDLVSAFIQESREGLEELDQDFMALEDNPEDGDRLHSAFRTIHTIKGTAGFVGLPRLQGMAHTMESVMDRLRGFEIPLTAGMMDDLLAGTDLLRKVVDRVAGGGGDDLDMEATAQRLRRYLDPNFKGEDAPAPAAQAEAEGAASDDGDSDGQSAAPAEQGAGAAAGSSGGSGGEAASGGGEGDGQSREAQTLRVPLDRLDRLFNLVGELVLTRNQTRELARRVSEQLSDERLSEDLAEEAHRLDLVTSDLQSAVMQTRMHSLAASFNKFKRVIRDLARKTHKEVQLNISGEQTELDRNVIEAIQDPLVHLIRNSVDHGVEEPEAREAVGKPRAGTVNLKAYYEENFVVIEVTDDGAGLSAEKLRGKAVERGIIDANEADQMSDREAQQLIFSPGFSSAEQVSDISGRGVGMDVVRSNVEELKGSIELDSELGQGTSVQIRLPLTLSIQQTLIVQIGPEHFAIPLETVKETLDFEPDKVTTVRGQRVYQREGEILPILQMTELFGMSRVHDADAHYLVVLELGMQRAGILVDRIVGKEEAVMKSLDALKGIYEPEYFAGASVRGDGRISLVVDVARLFSKVATMRGHAKAREVTEEEQVTRLPYLLLDGGTEEVYALPREEVHHIELIGVSEVQWMNGHEYLKRENRAVPVVRLATITGESFKHPGGEAYVVFVDDGSGNWAEGILTNHLHGIQYLQETQQGSRQSSGVAGAALWENRVVGVLDRQAIDGATNQRVPDDLAAGA